MIIEGKINYKIVKNILISLIIIISFFTQTIYIKAEENKVIKVGYPIVEGFIEINDGVYSGYAYEYLCEIAKYTGWEYEFIEMSLNDSIIALKDGKIDLAAGMMKNEQTMEIYDFPEEDIGATYTTLCALKDNQEISQSDYETLNGIRVGYYETSKVKLENFKKFYESNNIENIELVPYPYEEGVSLVDKLKSKEVDAIIDGDLLLNNEEKVIAKFGAIPYYLATTKGNTEIVSDLNNAIFKIKEKNPSFDQNLYEQYFNSNNDHSFTLTEEEKEYIKNTKQLKAIYIQDYNPLQYYDSNTKKAKGVFIDMINLVSKKSGLKFNFIAVKTYEEAYNMLKNKKADLIVGVPSVNSTANEKGIKLTASYLDLDMVKVFRKGEVKKEGKLTVGLPAGYGYANLDSDDKIIFYDNIEECIKALNEEKVDMVYGNHYTITHYTTGGYYPNLSIISDEITVPASVGFSKSVDKNLFSIFNKIIYSIPYNEIEDIVYKNTMNINHKLTLKQFFFENTILCTIIILIVLTAINIIIYIIVKLRFDKIKKSKDVLFRKTQTDCLTGIYNREACKTEINNYLDTKDLSLYGVFIIIDIDYFKQVNDNLGHKIGDDVLIEFSKLLEQSFRDEDIVCRMGGDEFIVFMKDITESNLDKIDEKLGNLCTLMNKEVTYNGKRQKISISIGAVALKKDIDFEKLYQIADEMLYKTKSNGKNGFSIKKI